MCMRIGEAEGADMEVLALAAMLHDIGREHETVSKGMVCHAEKGAELAIFAGEVGAKLHNSGVNIEHTKPYTEEDTAYREFCVKLKHLRDRMLTAEGRRIAEERHRFMEEFFDRLDKEAEGKA